MQSKKPLTDKNGEVRELNENDFATAKSFSDLPGTLQKKLKTRGRQKTPIKVPVSIRLSPEVVQHFKSLGAGWQIRINEVLKKHIQQPAKK